VVWGLVDVVTLASLLIGALAISFFVFRQLRLTKPILEVRVLALPIFSLVTFITIIGFSLLIATETILPMYVQNAQQYSAYFGGLFLMPGALTLAVLSF